MKMTKEDKRALGKMLVHFDNSPGGKLLRKFWMAEADLIVRAGMKYKRESDWAVYEGFQKAINIYEGAMQYARTEQEKEEE